MVPPIRLNKFLVDVGVCSRREADRLIESKDIEVDGKKAVLGQKVTGDEVIRVKGKVIKTRLETKKRVYIAYHKPVGVICSSDPKAKDNIIDAVHYPERVFHIGRLDVASSGLILLTNDGDIVNKILRAENKHEKEYIVKTNEPVTVGFIENLKKGVQLDDGMTLPATVKKMGDAMFAITLIEGRNRQIRRMCEALRHTVKALKRIRVMHIKLDDIPPGKWRLLTDDETKKLLASTA